MPALVIGKRPGAGGGIGAGIVARAPRDGYTLLLGAVTTHLINPSFALSGDRELSSAIIRSTGLPFD